MNILIATGIYPPDIGGPATYTKTVAETFSRAGHQVTVVTYGDGTPPRSGFPVIVVSRLLPKGIRHLRYFWMVFRRSARADVIFAQDTVSAGLPARAAAILRKKPFFLKVVGDYAWEQGVQRFGVQELLDDFLRKRYGFRVEILRGIQRYVARGATCILVPSEYLGSVVEAWGIAKEHIHVVYNAVELAPVSSPREEAERRIGVSGFLLLSIGRLVPWKGFRMLVDLMPRIRSRVPNAKLLIVGAGPVHTELQERIAVSGLEDTVLLVGTKSHEEIAFYYRAARICLLNTGYEGFSHQILEAMSAGIPVITTLAGGNKEIVQDGENALVASFNNSDEWETAVVRLMGDEELQRRLAHAGEITARAYNQDSMIRKTLAILTT